MTPAELADLHQKCFPLGPRPWTKQEISTLLETDNVYLIENAYGFLLFSLAGPEIELLTVAVDPDRQRRGIGRKLVQDMHRIAQENGVFDVFLEVAVSNAPACALYKNMGYKVVGKRQQYYRFANGESVDALVMKKEVASSV